MSILSYSDLQTNVAAYAKRQDLSALIPTFISLAEEWFNRELKVKARRTSFLVTPTQPNVAIPSDSQKIIKVWYGGLQLDFFPPSFNSSYAGGPLQAQDFWNGYQIDGDTLTLGVPQMGQVLQIDYYQQLEPLSDTNVSNWLLEDGQTAYLFGTLMQLAIYTRDLTSLQLWQTLRDQAIASMEQDDDESQRPDDPLTIRAG